MTEVKTDFEKGWDDFEDGLDYNPKESFQWQQGWKSAKEFWHS